MIRLKIIICGILVTCLLIALTGMSQEEDPVHWIYSAKKVDQNLFEIHITANMNPGWHVYSQNQPKEAIALPTKIKFSLNPMIKHLGKLKEIGKKEKQEIKNIGIVQYDYGGTVDFVQVIMIKAKIKTNISGTVSYQACTDEMCRPANTISFSLSLN